MKLLIADLNISGPFCVLDLNSGNYIYSFLDPAGPGDIPQDIAVLPVLGMRVIGSAAARVLYIDTACA